jgi:curli production assembly/transport component CsgG
MSVAAEKSVASHRTSTDVFKFIELGTEVVEIEAGYSVNEPTNIAVRSAIEAAIIEIIYEGVRKGLWNFKE